VGAKIKVKIVFFIQISLYTVFSIQAIIFSMSITQTIEVPPSRRLTIDVPRELPAGTVVLTFTPAKEAVSTGRTAEGKKSAVKPPVFAEQFPGIIDPNIPTPHTDFLAGILAGAGDITTEQIREERLARYLQ
jgi:hypothetical protein